LCTLVLESTLFPSSTSSTHETGLIDHMSGQVMFYMLM
jgi:hypothetical protein